VNRIHPLFDKFLAERMNFPKDRQQLAIWCDAGKPVLAEEERRVDDFAAECGELYPAIKEKGRWWLDKDVVVAKIAAKDARIKDLEETLVVEKAGRENARWPEGMLRDKVAELEGTIIKMRLSTPPRAAIRNDALEEAALEVQRSWDRAFDSAPGVPLRTLEDCIRRLKK
jgi:hypothetical protein